MHIYKISRVLNCPLTNRPTLSLYGSLQYLVHVWVIQAYLGNRIHAYLYFHFPNPQYRNSCPYSYFLNLFSKYDRSLFSPNTLALVLCMTYASLLLHFRICSDAHMVRQWYSIAFYILYKIRQDLLIRIKLLHEYEIETRNGKVSISVKYASLVKVFIPRSSNSSQNNRGRTVMKFITLTQCFVIYHIS
jgi:hypothetical protein